MIGRYIQHYRIVDKLGQGGMGVVYKALDTHLDREVAIKALPPDAVADPDRKRRFVQEAKAASALNHPNIVTIHDIASGDGGEFIVMEHVRGKTLAELIGPQRLPLKEVLKFAIQIADALAAAHAAGIVHRDLKPGNLMITDKGLVKVLDFGLAKLLDVRGGDTLAPTATLATEAARTRPGAVIGTAAYMSPEQADGLTVDERSDIFSFGSVLYEMLTGRRAFEGRGPMSTLAAVLQKEPEPVSDTVPGVPPELDEVVRRCLHKDPGRRFQHIVDVKVVLERIAEGAVPRRPAVHGVRRKVWAATVSLLAVLIAAVAWYAFRSEPTTPALTAVPLTSFAGEEYDPALSPDGRQVAFTWNGPARDNHDIYVKLIGAGSPLRLTSLPAVDHSPAWSPDGRFIAFYREHPEGREIFEVPALGGPERRLGLSRGLTAVSSLAWFPDGKSLLIVDRPAPEEPVSVFSLSRETGEKRRLTSATAGQFPGDARFALSPDARMLAFLRLSGGQFGRTILVQPLDAGGAPRGNPAIVSSNRRAIAGLDWSSDGRSLIFSERGGNQNLWRISVGSRGAPKPFTAVGENATTLSVARQGGRLAYTQYVYDINVWRVRPGAGSTAPPVRLLASTREDRMPVFSPDGGKLVFVSERSGQREVWVSDSEGGNALQLTAFAGAGLLTPRWSPDGRRIAFAANTDGQWDIYIIGADGGAARRITADPGDELHPCWSQDGRWIYFASNRSGARQVWKVPPEGGAPVQVTRNGGNQAIEALDGNRLYYTRLSEPGIWAVPPSGGDETQVLDQGETYDWSISAEGLYLLRPNAKPAPAIEFFRFGSHRGVRVALLPKGIQVRDLAVSPDGQALLYAQAEQPESDIMLVENFR